MKVSLRGMARNLRTFVDEVVRRAETGEAIDDEFLYDYQPGLVAFGFEELLQHLGDLKADPARLQEFFELYVDAPAPRKEA